MSGKCFCIAVLLLLFAKTSIAQTEDVPLQIRLTSSAGKDSLWLTVTKEPGQRPSSLMVIATLAISRLSDTVFLPVVDSESIFCLVVPADNKEDLILQGYFFPGIFSVAGKLNSRRKQPNIRVILLTENNAFYNKEIVLDETNRFRLPAMVFEKKATLVFNYLNSRASKDHPDIVLDNISYASNFRQVIFNDTIRYIESSSKLTSDDTLQAIAASKKIGSGGKYKTLSEVSVSGKMKTKLERFNENYSTGLFNDPGERIIDCLDNEDILSFSDCMSFLQTRVPGISIYRGQYGNMVAKWRGVEIRAFYIDEIQVDLDQLLGVSTSDIAMIKAYPPPFFGASGNNGEGGAVAVYTRRGESRRPYSNENKWLFTIKGYSPSMYVLFERH